MPYRYENTKPWAVYALLDPSTTTVRYVGVTRNLQKRMNHHVCTAGRKQRRKEEWLSRLLASGSFPIVVILETGVGRLNAAEAEKWWIAHFDQMGADLTNATRGGCGTHGFSHSPETRAKLALTWKGRHLSPETRERIRAALVGRHPTDETRAKLRLREHTAETRAKIAVASRGRGHTPEARAKIKAWHTGYRYTPEARLKMSLAHLGRPWSAKRRAAYLGSTRQESA